jgi:galactonate dehydratase
LAENIDLVAEVRRALPIPIVTGEAIYSKEANAPPNAPPILNPDICAIGGITAMLDIAAVAQPQAVVMAPHNFNSTLVGMAATVHVSTVIPNFRITAYLVNFEDLCGDIATASLVRQDGWIDLPTGPGDIRGDGAPQRLESIFHRARRVIRKINRTPVRDRPGALGWRRGL